VVCAKAVADSAEKAALARRLRRLIMFMGFSYSK
jgi:hypothetical protein